MNCFNHPDKPALGMCKSCAKGLCRDCMAEVTNGLACKNQCEDRVNLINCIIDSNKQVLTVANVQSKGATAIYIALGALLCGFGLVPFFIYGQKGTLIIGLMGLVLLIAGLLRLKSTAKYPEIK